LTPIAYTSSAASIEARKLPSLHLSWSVTINGDEFCTPPLIVGDLVYIETYKGTLLAYDAKTGKRKLQMSVGSPGFGRGAVIGLAYGSNELIVPNGDELVGLAGS
jgi:outer membrane protein assembly factor BamB